MNKYVRFRDRQIACSCTIINQLQLPFLYSISVSLLEREVIKNGYARVEMPGTLETLSVGTSPTSAKCSHQMFRLSLYISSWRLSTWKLASVPVVHLVMFNTYL